MAHHHHPRNICIILLISLAAALPALAQDGVRNLRATKTRSNSISLRWDSSPGSSGYGYYVYIGPARGDTNNPVGGTNGTSYTIKGLRPNTAYRITVVVAGSPHLGQSAITVQTGEKRKDKTPARYVPAPVTCPHLPPRVVVTGYVENTQCQVVGEVVISGHPDLRQRGFIDAVDAWNYINGGLVVCFRSEGWLVFLDAAYAPRMATELDHKHRDGMTCGEIDRAGTVALLESPPVADPAPQPAAAAQPSNSLPVFESIPLHDCQIKLLETLFLRAEPAGEIIGLVWLNSEVQAFEIHGYWYKVEFEGQTGYVSRYHREVLRGGCG